MKYRNIKSALFLALIAFSVRGNALAFDPESLALLKKSVSDWNASRLSQPEKSMDLFKANLEDANLKGANLSRTILVRAELSGANLNSANLKSSNLKLAFIKKTDMKECDLSGAYLVKANLKGSFMKNALLKGANLHGANLRWVKFDSADLGMANLSNTVLFEASLEGADLRGANLKGAIFIDQANLNGALISNNTILPSGEKATSSWSLLHNARFFREEEIVAANYDQPPAVDVDSAEQVELQTLDKQGRKNRNKGEKSDTGERVSKITDSKQQALIIEDVESWNKMRTTNPEVPVSMKEEKFTEYKLQGVNLQKAELTGTSFEDANLDNSNLAGANLK
ncbi:MAG: pentapeptide repeat-containing protein, partial [Chlorobiaceae bacterium]|nr:pentapeptide repeat-containing protein [Chlorobiaceae bacterium]